VSRDLVVGRVATSSEAAQAAPCGAWGWFISHTIPKACGFEAATHQSVALLLNIQIGFCR